MTDSIFTHLSRNADGSVSAVLGSYLLQSAFQPILRETAEGVLELEAVEGCLRASQDGRPVDPCEVLAPEAGADRALQDSLCRSLHILNAGALASRDVVLLVNARPGLFGFSSTASREVDRMCHAAREANLPPARIACAIAEVPDADPALATRFAAQLREAGFLVAIDGYSATEGDLERQSRLRPGLLKFDPHWVQRFAGSTAGTALLRVIVARFEREGIRPIVPGIASPRQVELCREIGLPLMQGDLLAQAETRLSALDRAFSPTPARRSPGPMPATPADAIRAARLALEGVSGASTLRTAPRDRR